MSTVKLLLTGILLVLASTGSFAQTPPSKPPTDKTPPEGVTPDPTVRATKLAKEGAELARQGRYRDASGKFLQSLAIAPIADVYYNLAYCYEQLGDLKGCVDNYTKYLDAYRKEHNGADPAEVQGIKRSIDKCTEKQQPPISLTSNPSGASVALGTKDAMIGTTPLTYKLKPGSYKLFITRKGYVPTKAPLVVLAGQAGKFHFDLQKVKNTGQVSIEVNIKGATIYIDGKNVGISPYVNSPELKFGRHQVVIKKDRYTEINATFQVNTGETTQVSYTLYLLDPPPSWRSYLGWAFVSIGVVAVAGGIVAFKFADVEFNDTKDFDDLVFLQNLGYGLGGGLLGTGTALLVWESLTDHVDSRDLVQMHTPPFQLSVVPIRKGAFVGAAVRF